MAWLDDGLARSLAAFRPQRGWCLTLFLDLDPHLVPTGRALGSHVASLADEARRAARKLRPALDHERAMRTREDVERVAGFLEDELDRSGAAGLAMYVSGLDDIWHEVRLPFRVDDAVHLGPAFVVAPLVETLERDREVLLVAVSRDRGTLWRSRRRRPELLAELEPDTQAVHVAGPFSQDHYQRAREREALTHLRAVAHAVGEAVAPGSETLVVTACVEEDRRAFESALPQHAREALLGWASVAAHAGADALQAEAERLLDERLLEEHRAFLDRWHEERAHGRAASSWDEAIAAAWEGRVERALVDGSTAAAWECPACGRGQTAPGSCDFDGTPVREAIGGALELVVREALVHSGNVGRLRDRDDGAVDGVAALLRYALVPG